MYRHGGITTELSSGILHDTSKMHSSDWSTIITSQANGSLAQYLVNTERKQESEQSIIARDWTGEEDNDWCKQQTILLQHTTQQQLLTRTQCDTNNEPTQPLSTRLTNIARLRDTME